MKSNYRRIGDFIELVDERNSDLQITRLLGLTINKVFIESVANTIGTNMKRYKIIRKNQFACSTMQVRRDKKMPVALLKGLDEAIISPAYPVFQIQDTAELLPDYLMMWFSRAEFDREACFHAVGGVRGSLEWEDFLNMELPVPSIAKQQTIVKEYQTITHRIALNEQLNQKLEETAQTLYKHWFVDFEFPDENGLPYQSNGGEMVWNEELEKDVPLGWEVEKLEKICSLKYGKMLSTKKFTKIGYPVYSGYGIRGYYKDYMFEESEIVVIARGVSGTGKVEMSPPKCFLTNLSIAVLINKSNIKKQYLYYFLFNGNLRKLDSGSAQSQITISDLGFIEILIPPLNKQSMFETKIVTIRKRILILEKELKLLKRLLDTFLQKIATA